MLGPLVVLAGGSIVAGYPLFRSAEGDRIRLPGVVQPVFRLTEEHLPHVTWLPVVATISAVLGILAAWYLYLSMPDLRVSLKRALSPLLRVFEAKYWFDDVYNGFVRRVVVDGSRGFLWQRFDAGFVDGIVNGTGRAAASLGQAMRPVETGFVRHYVLLVLAGAVALVTYLLWS
jgi:NADH-quinone oxidoreductase subunit L